MLGIVVLEPTADGEPLWARSFDGAASVHVQDIAVTADRRVAVSGQYRGDDFNLGLGAPEGYCSDRRARHPAERRGPRRRGDRPGRAPRRVLARRARRHPLLTPGIPAAAPAADSLVAVRPVLGCCPAWAR
jgi:hypothetical protein